MRDHQALWHPDSKRADHSFLRQYMRWLEERKGLSFADYRSLWEWSIHDLEGFWGSFWAFANIRSHSAWTTVLEKKPGMIGSRWFCGSTVNYAEHIFLNRTDAFPAIISRNERGEERSISWDVLEQSVAKLAAWMRQQGIGKGDRVVSVMPNIPETVIAFLAAQSIGAVWSSCSPDFGNPAILDRFVQIQPKLLFVTDGYYYNGKAYAKIEFWNELILALPELKATVMVDLLGGGAQLPAVPWDSIMQVDAPPLTFEPLTFDHPLWILYSSGTTGKPKAIVHSVGGNLIEHLKVLLLHWDVRPGERFFWYSTTGWMMWNFSVASLLAGATLMLYDGSPAWPGADQLWHWAKEKEINHFGSGAAFFIASMKSGMHFHKDELPALRTIGSTGSPLPAECFSWIYRDISPDVWLISFSGGTDICSGFVGGCPLLPVYPGEIQCRLLGVALEAWDDEGHAVVEQMGEMVILEPMPSMPIGFWNDADNRIYRESYYSTFPGVWRHGDWIEVTERGGVIIYGRSDATLNRDGVRIGTSEIYGVLDGLPEVADSLVICLEQDGGKFFMPLFVQLKPGFTWDKDLESRIRHALRVAYSPRHVPDKIYAVQDIPYTISGKKMEMPVKRIFRGTPPAQAASRDTMRNPAALDAFAEIASSMAKS